MPVVRNGFVSNSSSSSFIIVMRHRPTTLRGMRRMFGIDGRTTVYSSVTRSFRWGELSHDVFTDLSSTPRASWQSVLNEIESNSMFPSMVVESRLANKLQVFMIRDYTAIHNSRVELNNEMKDIARRRLNQMYNLGYHFAILSYGDEDGTRSSALEHGRHWSLAEIPVIQISHH